MDISPEIQEFSDKLYSQYPVFRMPHPSFYPNALRNALEFRGCFFAFWRMDDGKNRARYLTIYRTDRKPTADEALPFLQTLFEDGKADILEVSQSKFALEFVQSKNIYETQSMAEQMGLSVADLADKRDEVEQFDFDVTSTAQHMKDAKEKNGQ